MKEAKSKRQRIPPGYVLLQVVVPRELQREFKASCVRAGETMSARMEALLRAQVKESVR